MQRINSHIGPLEKHFAFDGTFIYYSPDIGTLQKVHKDNGLVATIDFSSRSSIPTYIEHFGLNVDNNIVAIDHNDCAFCLLNSDSLEGTIVPSDDDFSWITIGDYDVYSGQYVDGEVYYVNDLGLLDSKTGDILDAGAKWIAHSSGHCMVSGIYGVDATSAMYVSKIQKVEMESLSYEWEADCGGCYHTTVGHDGFVYAMDDYDAIIYQFDPKDGTNTKSIDLSEFLSEAAPFIVDVDGSIFIENKGYDPDGIYKFDDSGNKVFELTAASLTLEGAI